MRALVLQFLSANARPGNGGPLMQPKGQTSVLYRCPQPRAMPCPSSSQTAVLVLHHSVAQGCMAYGATSQPLLRAICGSAQMRDSAV